jgi:hypothetical protein
VQQALMVRLLKIQRSTSDPGLIMSAATVRKRTAPAYLRCGATKCARVSRSLVNDLLSNRRNGGSGRRAGRSDLVLQSRIDESGAVIIAEPVPRVRGETNQLAHVFAQQHAARIFGLF